MYKKLLNLSKACDCIPHDLLIVKLATHGFGNAALVLITDCLINSNLQTSFFNG